MWDHDEKLILDLYHICMCKTCLQAIVVGLDYSFMKSITHLFWKTYEETRAKVFIILVRCPTIFELVLLIIKCCIGVFN